MSLQDASNAGIRDTRFKPGQSGNPGHVPRSKTRLGKKFIDELLANFEANGPDAIEELRTKHVDKYCQMIADMLPSETNVNVTAVSSTGLERLSANIEWLRGMSERRGMEPSIQVLEPERSVLSPPVHTGEKRR